MSVALPAFGLFAVTLTLLCYALDERNRYWTLGFAGGCALSAVYGFLQGAWPFGMIEIVWTVVAFHRFRRRE